MGHRVTKPFTPLAEAATHRFRQPVFQLLEARLRPVDARLRVVVIQALNSTLLPLIGAFKLRFHGDAHPLAQAFQSGLLAGQPQLRVLLLQTMEQLGKSALATGEEIVHCHLQPLLPGLQLAQQLLLIAADDLCGGRRGRRAQVGNKISDSDVGFMANGADDRDLAGEDSSRHPLIVKTPQILQRTAAASDNQHVTLPARVRQRDGAHNLPGSIVTLNRGRVDDHRQPGVAAPEDMKNIVQRGTGFRGDDPDAVGGGGERLLMFLIEQPFRG